MKIILFEGPDKVGKTTTIRTMEEYIKDHNKIPLISNLPYSVSRSLQGFELGNKLLEMQVHNLINMSNFLDDNYICLIDRLHISERVFGEILRHRCDYCLYKRLDMRLRLLDANLMYIKPVDINANFERFKINDKIDGLTGPEYYATCSEFEERFSESEIQRKYKITTAEINQKLEGIMEELI